jgi:hypothetical protein
MEVEDNNCLVGRGVARRGARLLLLWLLQARH